MFQDDDSDYGDIPNQDDKIEEKKDNEEQKLHFLEVGKAQQEKFSDHGYVLRKMSQGNDLQRGEREKEAAEFYKLRKLENIYSELSRRLLLPCVSSINK